MKRTVFARLTALLLATILMLPMSVIPSFATEDPVGEDLFEDNEFVPNEPEDVIKFNKYVNDFESANVGDTVPGITGINAAYKIALDPTGADNKVWALGNSNDGTGIRDGNAMLAHEAFSADMGDKITLSADYYIPTGTGNQFQTQFKNYNGVSSGAATSKYWGDIYVIRSRDGVATIGREASVAMYQLPYDEWFTVAVELTMSTNTYTVYVNGYEAFGDQHIGSGIDSLTGFNASTIIMGKQNKSADTYLAGTMYLDNISLVAGEYEGRIEHPEHAFAETVTSEALASAATCTDPAYYHYSCVCGVLSDETFAYGEALGHAWDEGATAEDGSTVYTCDRCGESYTEAHEHTYGAWQKVTAATCTTAGEARRECKSCDYFETRELPALGHKTVQYAEQAPTCGEIGWNAYEACSRCDYTTYEEIPATGKHTWLEGDDIGDGLIHYYCDSCDATYTEERPPVAMGTLVIGSTAQTVRVGDTVKVTFEVFENPGVSGLVVTPSYDASVLKLISTEEGSVFEDCTADKNLVFQNTGNSYESGTLVTFTFEVLTEGEAIVTLIARECANAAYEDISVEITAATVTAVDFYYGDVNDDGTVTLIDSILLRNYLADYDYETGTSTVAVGYGADVNGDGRINLIDSILLTNYLAAYDYDTGTSDVVLGPAA